MREVTETQAAKEWSIIEVVLTEQEEIFIAHDFAKDFAKSIALWLLQYNGADVVRKEYREYRSRRIEWRQESLWKETTGAQWDINRSTYIAFDK